MESLHVELSQTEQALVLRLSGGAGVLAVDALDRALRLIKVRRPRRLIVDLAGLSFIASLGLGLLVALSAELRRDGGTVALVAPTAEVAGAIKRCRLDRVLPVRPSVDDALQA